MLLLPTLVPRAGEQRRYALKFMAYYILLYFNWIPALIIWGINRKRRDRAKGIYYILIGAALELSSYFIHLMQWNQLRGEPDQLYAWIFPLLISVIGIVLILIGLIRSFKFKNKNEMNLESKNE